MKPWFIVLYFAAMLVGFLFMVLVVGYPGDGAKGVPTAFGRMERGHSPQYARDWR